MKTYSELILIPTYKERFEYASLNGQVGSATFGADRYINQQFYRSREWRRFRDQIIVRDGGCDLGDPDRPIGGVIIIHHLNPIRIEDFEKRPELLMDPDLVICVSDLTHKAIHYGDFDLLPKDYVERKPNDTIPWRH